MDRFDRQLDVAKQLHGVKSAQIGLRLSPLELEIAQRAMKHLGTDFSAWMEHALLLLLKDLESPTADLDALRLKFYDFKRTMDTGTVARNVRISGIIKQRVLDGLHQLDGTIKLATGARWAQAHCSFQVFMQPSREEYVRMAKEAAQRRALELEELKKKRREENKVKVLVPTMSGFYDPSVR